MLSKLFKYEIKATARLFIPLYLTILAFAVINRFLFPIFDIGEKSSPLYDFVMGIGMFIYATLMVGLVVMTLFVMIQRFYKNLLGDEGYLMFTLPVQSHKHIFSKLTISMLWTVISGIVAFCSILILSSKGIPTSELLSDLAIAFEQFKQFFGSMSYLVGFEAIVLAILNLAASILNIYAAIALGHLFNKYKLLISFVMYIILRTVSQLLMMLFAVIFMNQVIFGTDIGFVPSALQINSYLLISVLYFAALSVGYFILTNYILKRKLNLE